MCVNVTLSPRRTVMPVGVHWLLAGDAVTALRRRRAAGAAAGRARAGAVVRPAT